MLAVPLHGPPVSLTDDLAVPVRRGTRPCEFGAWVASLPETDQAAVRAALARKQGDPLYWPIPKLWRRLTDAGYTGSEATVYKHRTGVCQSCR
jgi:hypothetical protein